MLARLLITIMFYLSMVYVANANDKMIRRLDDAIEHRPSFLQRKEQRIDSLRMLADSQQNRQQQLEQYRSSDLCSCQNGYY